MLQGASLTLATLTDSTSGTTYTGLELNIDEAGLVGVTDVTLTVAAGSVLFNQVSAGTPKLDWATTTSDNGLLPANTFSTDLIASLDLAISGTVLGRTLLRIAFVTASSAMLATRLKAASVVPSLAWPPPW